ncbi:uncharacterized protein LOC112100178 [Citrus clementina]|uniref:uncharacterized protein LOC112100178 n=1 Tax=Citrus clementina TaxID=85681 RepID=UPI000CECE97A|nr:uncharacterized protein LOC112100178 [Citrus x clementina]
MRVLRIIANLFSDLKTLTNEQEIFSANYGQVPAAVKPLPFSYASPAFLSVTGSPSPLQQGVDCNLAYQQSLEKQQTNKDLSGSQHSHMPVQYPRFIGQTNKDPQGSQHSQTPVQYSRFIGQTNKDPQGSQRSHMPVQYPGFIRHTDKDPRGSQHSHMSVQYPGFIGQTNKFPPGNQHSHMPVQYPGFTGHTNKDPSGSQHSCKPVQYPGFVDPQLKQLQNLRSNMKPPGSHHSQLPQQHLRLTKDQLESLQWQLYMETPLSNNSPQHHSFNEDPLKRGGTPASIESQPQQALLHAPLTFNQDKSGKHVQDVSEKPQPIPSFSTSGDLPRASYKGKEKVTSPSANAPTFTSVVNKPLGPGSFGNCGQLDAPYPFILPKESYNPRLPTEFLLALEACGPPGVDIPSPYGETDEAMFEIPFFKNTGSSNPSGAVSNLNIFHWHLI